MAIPAIPSISAGGGGPSSAGANNGVSNPFTIPFNFDNSGWNVQLKSSGSQTASGNKDANKSTTTTDPQGGTSSGSMGGGFDLPLIAMLGAGLYFLTM